MRRLAVVVVVLLALLSLAGCDSRPAKVPYQERMFVFGTLVTITIAGVPEERARAATADVARELETMHDLWHAWEPGPLGRTNTLLATTGWFAANPSVLPLIREAQDLSARSGGLFNPAIGQLVALWGFHGDEPDAVRAPPRPEAIAALVAQDPSMDAVEIDGIRMRSTNPAVRLDFGAFAKGVAVDRAIARLRELGIENAIVNTGGDLRAIGSRDGRPWRIGVRHPRQMGQVLASLEVSGDESIFTSGDYERHFDHDETRYHHILDPRTGYPARGTTSVTVLHEQGAVADAAATALFVAGPKQWVEVAHNMGVDFVMLVDAEGTVHLTPAMAERVRFEIDPPPTVRVSAP